MVPTESTWPYNSVSVYIRLQLFNRNLWCISMKWISFLLRAFRFPWSCSDYMQRGISSYDSVLQTDFLQQIWVVLLETIDAHLLHGTVYTGSSGVESTVLLAQWTFNPRHCTICRTRVCAPSLLVVALETLNCAGFVTHWPSPSISLTSWWGKIHPRDRRESVKRSREWFS